LDVFPKTERLKTLQKRKIMKTKYKFIAAILFTLFVSNSQASKIIIAPSGSGYTSIQQGLNDANAGDTVLVKAGTYYESVSFVKSGSENGYIILLAEKGAVIDGSKNGLSGITIENLSYIKVIGFEIQNFKGTHVPIGISVKGSGSNIELRNNKVHHIENATGNAHGIAVYGTSEIPLTNIVVDGNEIRNCKLGQSESLVLNGNVTHFIVSNNIIHDNDNIGIDFIGFERRAPKGFDQARNGVCFGNIVYNITTKTNPTYHDLNSDGIYVDGGRDIIIEKNIVYNCDIGVELASEHGGKSTENIIVRNNFVSGSFQANIMAGGYASDRGNAINIAIVNNTTYLGGQGEVALQHNSNSIIIKNNIFYGKADQPYLQNRGSNNSNIHVDNNIYYGQSKSSPGSWDDAKAKYVNPLLADPYSDMHLKPGSPAVDAGIDSGLDENKHPYSGTEDIDNKNRIENGIIDIGADEFK
jgi:parallel beta-helix repeat protein